MFDLSGIVAHLSNTVDLTVDRPNATIYTNGVAQAQTFASFNVDRASVQPISGRDLIRAPEGSRPTDSITVFCSVELKERDRLTVPARGAFEVFHVSPWAETGNFCKALARRLASVEPRA